MISLVCGADCPEDVEVVVWRSAGQQLRLWR